MILKIYHTDESNPYFRNLRMVRSVESDGAKEIFSIPFGNPVFLFFLEPGCVSNFAEFRDGIIIGQHTKPLCLKLNKNFHALAIHLKPYGLKQYLNIDASKLTNGYTDIHDFAITNELQRVLKQHFANESSIPDLLKNVFRNAVQYPVSDEIIKFINECHALTGSKVKDLLHNVYLTEKSLLRKCRSEVGLTPKQQLRVSRLFTIVQNLQQKNDWIQIANDYHFTDQSHLIKEFKSFATLSPVKFIDKGLLPFQQLPDIDSFEK